MTSKMVAVITGASSGLGKATALLFARNGYRLSLCGRNEKALEGVAVNCLKEGGLADDQVLTIIGDVCEEITLKNIVSQTDERFGRIDVLVRDENYIVKLNFPLKVNCAGIISPGGAEDTSLSVLDGLMDVNVKSMIRLSQLAVPHLQKTKGNILAASLEFARSPQSLTIASPKLPWTNSPNVFQWNWHRKGFESTLPALIVTELHRRSGMPEEQYNDFVRRGAQTHALGRVGTPEEVASSILFLARDATFTTGQLLKIDGGKALITPR
uniref:Short-chain dehydrogenase n=1 Tax=Globodera pallida TaxID=36090 RepID=A0A183C707_GLOPA